MDCIRPHVLLVEDDVELRTALAMLLQSDGNVVTPAEDALHAVSRAVREHPDLIILDLGLPGGGGFTVMERLKMGKAGTIPVLILTGSAEESNRERAAQLGACEFMLKPAEPRELLAAVRRLVRREAA